MAVGVGLIVDVGAGILVVVIVGEIILFVGLAVGMAVITASIVGVGDGLIRLDVLTSALSVGFGITATLSLEVSDFCTVILYMEYPPIIMKIKTEVISSNFSAIPRSLFVSVSSPIVVNRLPFFVDILN